MRVLVLKGDQWGDMGIARALDSDPGIDPILERDLADQTWSKSFASVVLVSEGTARADSKRSLTAIRRKFPNARILVHGESEDPTTIASFVAQGADGYFALSMGEEKLIDAVRTIAEGSLWMPRSAVRLVVDEMRSGRNATAVTAAEITLLEFLRDGLGNKEMAAQLGVAEVTIKSRLAKLYRRFSVKTRVQLLAFAIRNGLIARR